MSAAAAVLPFVWATAQIELVPQPPVEVVAQPSLEVVAQPSLEVAAQPPAAHVQLEPPPPEMAFYRKYTEAMLLRYVRMSMETGRVSSLLGQDMFRAHVTNYKVESFDDVVIFVHDVEKCLKMLEPQQHRLISRLSLQQYTVVETAELLRLKEKTVIRQYWRALDDLTRIFLDLKMLEPQKMFGRRQPVMTQAEDPKVDESST